MEYTVFDKLQTQNNNYNYKCINNSLYTYIYSISGLKLYKILNYNCNDKINDGVDLDLQKCVLTNEEDINTLKEILLFY